MLGYWDDDAATARAIDAARWMHTRRPRAMNDDGYVSISGRIKDMIIRGGENIYPREIEEFLHTHAKISEVQVIGVPDQQLRRRGLRVDPAARRRRPPRPTRSRSFCRGQIATYKIPRYIRFTSDFPMTVTGKDPEVQDARDLRGEELAGWRDHVEPT